MAVPPARSTKRYRGLPVHLEITKTSGINFFVDNNGRSITNISRV